MKLIRPSDIRPAADALKSGAVLAFPTETTYGLGCDPRNRKALDKIYGIKNRPADKSLPLVSASLEQVEKYFLLSEAERSLAAKYWSGPLSILLKPKPECQNYFAPILRDGMAAVRASSHPLVQELTNVYGFPLTATSANMSGQPACLSADEVLEVFRSADVQPDLIVDGGTLKPSAPSTLIKVDSDGKTTVLRQGAIFLNA